MKLDGPSATSETDATHSAQEEAYRHIHDRILSGLFVGGMKLVPADIAKELGISRMPVREALRQLHAEGLVTIRPNRGAVVTELQHADVKELFEIRAVLEGLAARFALSNLNPETMEDLDTLCRRMDRARTDSRNWLERHNVFHEFLSRQSGRPRLVSELNRLRNAVQPYLLLYMSVYNTAEIPDYEHGDILAALRSGDADFVESCMRNHVMSASHGITEFLRQPRSNPKSESVARTTDNAGKVGATPTGRSADHMPKKSSEKL